MKPESQRIAIAEACGWIKSPCETKAFGLEDQYFWHPEGVRYSSVMQYSSPLPPDYLNDLNAMHEAEHTIPYEFQPVYLGHLKRVLMRTSETQSADEFSQTCATAAQRAEAFLRTVNKWTDT